jgi:hypothetical protein
MESSSDSYIELRVNVASLLGFVLFIVSELLGIFGSKHSIAQYLKFYIFWAYIKCFPDSKLALEVGSVTSTTPSTNSEKKVYLESIAESSDIVEIRTLRS